jgi:hypothetical protein
MINNEIGKASLNIKEIKLNWEPNEITHPKDAELFNSYFSRIAEELLKQNDYRNTGCQRPQQK